MSSKNKGDEWLSLNTSSTPSMFFDLLLPLARIESRLGRMTTDVTEEQIRQLHLLASDTLNTLRGIQKQLKAIIR